MLIVSTLALEHKETGTYHTGNVRSVSYLHIYHLLLSELKIRIEQNGMVYMAMSYLTLSTGAAPVGVWARRRAHEEFSASFRSKFAKN